MITKVRTTTVYACLQFAIIRVPHLHVSGNNGGSMGFARYGRIVGKGCRCGLRICRFVVLAGFTGSSCGLELQAGVAGSSCSLLLRVGVAALLSILDFYTKFQKKLIKISKFSVLNGSS